MDLVTLVVQEVMSIFIIGKFLI